MWFEVASYLKFLRTSTNQHGIHSPFIFDLVTKCFYDRSRYVEYALLDAYRKSLLANHGTISVTDFGAGSRVFDSNERKISDIAKNAGISQKRAELLFRTVRYFKPKNILEIGTSLGLATSALALGNPSAAVLSLEGCQETASEAGRNLSASGLSDVEIRIGEFRSALAEINRQRVKYDLIYFDGNHQKDATLSYFETLLSSAHNDSVWIFDDIHWSEGMKEAWKEIQNHPLVTVTIDTFQWGFVFFRKEQEKENFTVRI